MLSRIDECFRSTQPDVCLCIMRPLASYSGIWELADMPQWTPRLPYFPLGPLAQWHVILSTTIPSTKISRMCIEEAMAPKKETPSIRLELHSSLLRMLELVFHYCCCQLSRLPVYGVHYREL